MIEKRTDRIERLLTRRNAWAVLLALVVVTLPAVYALRLVRLDYDFEKFFPEQDVELDRYNAFKQRFGHDNDFLMLGIPNAGGVFDRGFLVKVDSLAARLQRVPMVIDVASPTRLPELRITPVGVFTVPWLRTTDSTLAMDSARIWHDPFVRDRFFNADASALLVLLQCAPDLSKVKSDTLLARIEREVARSALPGVKKAGRIHGQQHYIALMEEELVTFFLTSAVVLITFLAIAFRKLWGVVAPVAVVLLTIIWQVALMSVLGRPLSILTMLLPTILFVVGMSDSVHIIERYIEALREGIAKRRALAITLAETGLSTFITMLTTAIGYATLATSGIRPMSEFGVFTAVGVFLAYALSFTLLPAALVLLPTPVPPVLRVREGIWDRMVHRLLRTVLLNRRTVLVAALAVVVISGAFIPRLKVNNFLLEDLPAGDAQKQGFLWFEREFGGVRPFELEVTVQDSVSGIWDLDALRAMELVQDHAAAVYGVKGIVSPVTLLRELNKAANGGDHTFLRLPDTQADVDRLVRHARKFAGAGPLRRLVDRDARHARLSGRMVDEGGHVHEAKNTELGSFIAARTNTARISFHQTGMAYLIDRNNRFLSSQMLFSLGSSFLLIAGIMAWVFRSWRVVLVALLPNVVPLVFIAGLMGVLGIDLKVSTAIIFSNAFGIAVDDTIHLLAKLRIELARGLSLPYALKRTYLSGGKAVIVMSIMLCAGFVTLIASEFASVYYMGLLITITLAVALMAELFLLPVLVMALLRER